ncbi:MAG: hypothetical protein RLZZ618_2523, partial [Pseudomonadota bacterium]
MSVWNSVIGAACESEDDRGSAVHDRSEL